MLRETKQGSPTAKAIGPSASHAPLGRRSALRVVNAGSSRGRGLQCSIAGDRLNDACGMDRRYRSAAILLLALCTQAPRISWSAEGQKFRADEWITECDRAPGAGSPDCSVTVPFWQTRGKPRGSLRSGCHAPEREYRDCRATVSGPSGAAGRQEPADRMPTAALLRLSERPSPRCLKTAQGRIAYFDRCVYGKW